MDEFNIWVEPYLCTGMEGIPSQPLMVAEKVKANTFEEACDITGNNPEIQKGWGYYNPVTKSLWGCKMHPSFEEAEAPWIEHRKRNR
jgi:hypothetical protein